MREFVITYEADQQFTAILGGQRCTIRIRYNEAAGRWMLDLSVGETPKITGRRITLGRDLLATYDLGLGAIFAWPTDDSAEPDRDSLPNGRVRLYHATADEVAAAQAA